MKYLKIDFPSLKIKGDPEDEETLQTDVYDRVMSMIESETLIFSIDEDELDEDEL